MKKEYVRPMMMAEEFVADEFVSNCFYIECDYAPGVEQVYQKHSEDKDGTGCGWKENQAITVLSGDINTTEGATISIKELNVKINNQPSGTRQCYFVDSEYATYPRRETKEGVNVGDTIYWVTNVGYWMPHKGRVVHIDSSTPNRS